MSENPIVVAAIVGSLRQKSLNRALFRAAVELAPPGMIVREAPIADLPHYNDELDVDGGPTPVRALREQIAMANAVLFFTPEYNYSIPGVLKNAIDWLSRPSGRGAINNKPGAIMGAGSGRSGSIRAQLHLRQVMSSVGMHDLKKPELIVTFAADRFDSAGRLVDPDLRSQIEAQLAALKRWVELLRA